MKRRHKRMVKVVGLTIGTLPIWWAIFAVSQGRHTAWLGTGLVVFGWLLLLCFPKLYGLYCRWTYESKLARMSSEERNAAFSRAFSEAEAFLHQTREQRRQERDSRVAWYW